jgi:DNA modification methylase
MKDMIAPAWKTPQIAVYLGDCLTVLRHLPNESINCCVTSPPYFGLRDYGVEGQIGLEGTLQDYINKLVEVFEEVRRVLTSDGTCWLNLGDSYASSGTPGNSNLEALGQQYRGGGKKRDAVIKPSRSLSDRFKTKDLMMVPHRVAIALQDAGWYVRSDIVWEKGNPMPESVTDRCTRSHEYIFLLTKSPKYYYDNTAIKEKLAENSDVLYRQKLRANATYNSKTPYVKNFPKSFDPKLKNARSVWKINTQPFPGLHFAVFPQELPRRCILAGCPSGGIVLDPFAGSGTTLLVAQELGRYAIGIELNPEYLPQIEKRCQQLTIFGAMEASS